MNKFFFACLLLVAGMATAQDRPYDKLGSPVGNKLPRVSIEKSMLIPRGSTPNLNGGIDSAGSIYYNTTDQQIYKYDGNGIWTKVGSSGSSFTPFLLDTTIYANGQQTTISVYTHGSIISATQVVGTNHNGSGFLNTRTIGDTTYIYYSAAPYDSVHYIFTGTDPYLLPPPDARATPQGNNEIDLAWNTVSHATGYQLEYSMAGSGWETLAILAPGDSVFRHQHLTPGTRIDYRLSALGGDGYAASPFSYASAMTAPLAMISTPSLTATGIGSTTVAMSWSAVLHAQGYLLQYSLDRNTWGLVVQSDSTTTSYTDTTLSPSTKYYFRVQAIGDDSLFSSSLFAVDSAITDREVSATALAAPAPTATPASTRSITINWGAITHATAYGIERSLNNSVWDTVRTVTTTSYTDTALIAATHYYYRVYAIGDQITYTNSDYGYANATTNSLTPLSAPALTATATSDSTIHLSWTASANATHYFIEYSLNNSTWTPVATVAPAVLAYDHAILQASTLYYYRLTSVGDSITYSNSTYATAQATTDASIPDIHALATPALTASPLSTTRIHLSWTDVTGEVNYVIERSLDNNVWTAIATLLPNHVTLDDSLLTASTQYYYRVYAVGNNTTTTNSDYGYASAITNALTVLTKPSLTVVATGATTTKLTWPDVANESSYRIQYSLNNSTWTLLNNPAANVTSYNHKGLTANTKYYYRLRAIGDNITYTQSDWDVDSATTQAGTATPLTAPTPTATATSENAIHLSWTNVSNESGYQLDRSYDSTVWVSLVTTAANTVTYIDSFLFSDTRYYYRVKAVGDGVVYASSAYTGASATTFPLAPDTAATIFGALVSTGNTNKNYSGLNNLQTLNARNSYTGTKANYPNFTAQGFRSFWTYSPAVPGLGTVLPTDTSQFVCTMDSIWNENGTDSLVAVAIINEINNTGYWTSTAANILNLIRAATNVAHAHGIAAYDGGITGPIMRYKCWEDYINRGYPDSAADYASRAFPTGTNLTRWRSSDNFGPKIRLLDTLLTGLATIPTDGINIHWYETVRDEDSLLTATNPLTFIQTARYLSRVTNKHVITNEYGLNNNKTITLMQQQVGAIKAMHLKYAYWYSGDLNYGLTDANGNLTPLGEAYVTETTVNQ